MTFESCATCISFDEGCVMSGYTVYKQRCKFDNHIKLYCCDLMIECEFYMKC